MYKVNSVFNTTIRITEERLEHIEKNHPEMTSQHNKILNTINNPDLVTKGDYGEYLAIRHFSKSPVSNNKYLVAVNKETDHDGFLLTAYFTRKYNQKREIVWTP